VYTPSHYAKVHNVKIINTLRSNLLMAGNHSVVDNVILHSSYTDHQMYVPKGNFQYGKNIYISGSARNECIAIGTVKNKPSWATLPIKHVTLENVYIANLSADKWGNYPAFPISFRKDVGEYNTLKHVYFIDDYDSLNAVILNSQQHTVIEAITIVYTGSPLEVAHLIKNHGTNAVYERLFLYATGATVRGINIHAAFEAVEVSIDQASINVPNYALRVAGGDYSAFYSLTNSHFFNNGHIYETGNVTRYIKNVMGYMN
jgi:hypothetical protein